MPPNRGDAVYISICRSDGQLKLINGESNSPSLDQQGSKAMVPDSDGRARYYRPAAADSTVLQNWLNTLGSKYTELLPSNPQNVQCVLSRLPLGYTLWEHVQTADGRLGRSRIDLYLYGHPSGKKYRSMQEYFPHFLWLAFDVGGDSANNCSCLLCFPSKKVPSEARASIAEAGAVGVLDGTSASTLAAPNGVMTKEQMADADADGEFLYRPGEIVWFDRFDDQSNWRLAIISKRRLQDATPQYLLQPLSNPFEPQPEQLKVQSSLRPWLAWSVPTTTIPQLNNMLFDDAPWERVQNGEFGSYDHVVDGSILAAKQIDASYNLFNKLRVMATGDTQFQGMFLGAEKVWVGEPVRLQGDKNLITVLVISELIETTSAEPVSVIFVGDIYQLVETNVEQPPGQALPPRMVTDIRFRNHIATGANTGTWYEWRLLENGARRNLKDVAGRWYETRTMLPILKTPAVFQLDLSNGITSDVGQWMNGRKHQNTLPDQRRKNRKHTLGKSVPGRFRVSKGADGSPEDDAFPAEFGPRQTQANQTLVDDPDGMDID